VGFEIEIGEMGGEERKGRNGREGEEDIAYEVITDIMSILQQHGIRQSSRRTRQRLGMSS